MRKKNYIPLIRIMKTRQMSIRTAMVGAKAGGAEVGLVVGVEVAEGNLVEAEVAEEEALVGVRVEVAEEGALVAEQEQVMGLAEATRERKAVRMGLLGKDGIPLATKGERPPQAKQERPQRTSGRLFLIRYTPSSTHF
jgi:hypothetical protein